MILMRIWMIPILIYTIESDDDTIIESGDEAILQHDNAIFSDSDDSTYNGWQTKFKNITLAIFF